MTRTPVEKTVRYATTVEDLAGAWAFVMEKLEQVGPDPSVEISPIWVISVGDALSGTEEAPPRHFSVVVSGMVEES